MWVVRTLIVLAGIACIGCPGDRIAQKTIHGSGLSVPQPMPRPAPAAQVVITDLRAPESVLHDPQQDVYLITNINGSMTAVDDNGFISRVDARSMAVTLDWIQAGRNGVHLDAPKGMGIAGDRLYVADITTVRTFDRRTGAPRGDIPIPGSTFLNDIASDGRSVYVSDTGVKLGPGTTILGTGTDAIWKITGDRAEKIASGTDLRRPNGLDFVNGHLRVVTFGSNEIYELDDEKRRSIVTVPRGQLDGIVHLADGTPIVSSWEGDGIFREAHDGHFSMILGALDSPADMGYDLGRRRLLVPHPPGNQVTIHTVY